LLTYCGNTYRVTSYVFMAFNSKADDDYIRETFILPYWFNKTANATYQLLTKGLTEARWHSYSPKVRKKLCQHGVIIDRQALVNYRAFFKEQNCLSESLLARIPLAQQADLISTDESLALSSWQVNPELILTHKTDLAISPLSDYERKFSDEFQPDIWVKDPIKSIYQAYWLPTELLNCVRQLVHSSNAINQLSASQFKCLSNSDIIIHPSMIEERRLSWQDQVEQLKKQEKKKGVLFLPSIIHPLQLAMMRNYFQFINKEKQLILDKANGKTHQRYWQHRDALTFYIQHQLSSVLNKIVAEPIKVGHNALTVYKTGSVLPRHQDDVLSFRWVISLIIDTTPEISREDAWPIYVQLPSNEIVKGKLAMGDGLMINPQMPHWRDQLEDHNLSIMLMWFVSESFRGYINGNWVD
jgi:hypothetical protein